MRIAKAIAHAGLCSRRDAEANTYQLFSICRDPADVVDRAAADPAAAQRMRALLREVGDIELTPLPASKKPSKLRAF